MTPYLIAPTDSGLVKNKKPWAIQDKSWQQMENAYAWRDRVKKREGLHLLGRLRRIITSVVMTSTVSSPGAGDVTVNLIGAQGLNLSGETNAQLVLGNITTFVMVLGAPISQTLTDSIGTGVLIITGAGPITAAYINYATGDLTMRFSGAAGASVATLTSAYYPGLPVMGIWQREIASLNNEETIFFDTKYSYKFVGGSGFQEFIPGTTWSGSDADFFFSFNIPAKSSTALVSDKYLFTTNFVNDVNNPIRYTDGSTWQNFYPITSQTGGVETRQFITQGKIMVQYYGRMILLNVWESSATNPGGIPDYATAIHYPYRARFSQVGNALESTDPNYITTAWRTDQFGKGGFIDCPVSEDIIYATFFKNTLIVGFERSTWQLRYVGEYGLPFIWERISSDFGGLNPFSSVLFDNGIYTIGNRAIVSSDAVSVSRIDLDIPDQVFEIANTESGRERVQGIRDFKKEVVYWCYPEMERSSDSLIYKYPNKVILYNYRNNTYAIFRDSITAFGIFQPQSDVVTWDRTDIFWDSDSVTWADINSQSENEVISSGNQQGFIHYYAYTSPDQESLTITNIDLTGPIVLTIPNHNLKENEYIQLKNILFIDSVTMLPVTTSLNDEIFNVSLVVDANTFQIQKWDSSENEFVLDFSYTPTSDTSILINGNAILLPKLDIITKDFNPYMQKGLQMKLSYIDFLTDRTVSGIVTVNLFLDTSTVQGNLIVGNKSVETYPITPFYNPFSQYAWHRFYATTQGQFVTIQLTYSDELMSNEDTHNEDFILNAMTLYVREGGKQVF